MCFKNYKAAKLYYTFVYLLNAIYSNSKTQIFLLYYGKLTSSQMFLSL